MKFIILGCGSSMGVPRPDGFFGNCDPKNKKNYTKSKKRVDYREQIVHIIIVINKKRKNTNEKH